MLDTEKNPERDRYLHKRYQRHGQHAHAQLLVHLALLECGTLTRCTPSLSPAALYARTWSSSSLSSIRCSWCGHCGATRASAAELQSCLVESASSSGRENCAPASAMELKLIHDRTPMSLAHHQDRLIGLPRQLRVSTVSPSQQLLHGSSPTSSLQLSTYTYRCEP